MKLYLNLLLVFVLSFNAFAANIGDDKVNVGNPANTSTDKEIIFNDGSASASRKKISIDGTTKNLKSNSNNLELGDDVSTGDKSIVIKRGGSNPVIKWNETLDRLEFSNDGTIYKAVGSGGGGGTGGVNLLNNDSFEDGISLGWTSSGGTFSSQNYTNTEPNNLKFARFIASASGQFFESSVYVIPDEVVGGCLAYARYKTSDNNAFKISFFSAGVEINSQTLPTTNGAWLTTPVVPVLCPASGTSVKARVEALAAGTIDADKAYLGTDNRLVKASGNFLVGRVLFGNDCSMTRGTNGTFSDFPVDSTCTITPAGRALAPTTNIPAIRFGQLNAGTYQVVVSGAISCGLDAGGDCRGTLRMFDGTNESRELLVTETTQNGTTSGDESTGNNYTFTMVLPSNASNVQFNLQGRTTLGSQIFNYSGDNLGRTSISVFALQTESDFAVTNDQSSWNIDVNIGGSSPTMGTGAVSSYAEITDAGLDMVLNTGSAPAKIPCSGTNPSTGLICSAGNEGVGVVFTPPYPGFFEVCADFAYSTSIAAAGNDETYFQLVETSPSSQTIIQEGKTRIGSRASAAAQTTRFPFRNCGTFFFSNVSEKTIRLAYERSSVSNITATLIPADRGGSDGQRDIHITVKPSTMNAARPVLTGETVTAPGGSKFRICQFAWGGAGSLSSTSACTSTPCTTYLDSCSALTGTMIRASTGDYNQVMSGWKPNTPISCNSQATGGLNAYPVMSFVSDGTGSLALRSRSANGITLTDAAVMMECKGERQ